MLSPKQAAERLGLTRQWVQRLCARGDIATENIGTDSRPRYVIQEQELERFAALARPQGRPRKETKMRTISAQVLYDRREVLGEISGTDLHQLFRELTGELSPSGHTRIAASAILQIADRLPPDDGTFGGPRRFLSGVLAPDKPITIVMLAEYPGQHEAYEEGQLPLRPSTHVARVASIREARNWLETH